jgi:predicted metal-dependent hydrolase
VIAEAPPKDFNDGKGAGHERFMSRPHTQKKVASKKAELFSSLDIAESRVYFRMRNNTRIRRSRLLVSPEEGLVVESPRELDLDHAQRLISRRKSWVLDALESVKEKQQRAADLKEHRNSILVFGREKIIRVRLNQSRDYVMESEDRIFIGFQKQRVRKVEVESALETWLKEKAKRYLPIRVRQLSRDRFSIKNVFVKDQKTIWGSCSADGNINLNWRLVMAPRSVCDYIILHELCHTRCLNHSRRFWQHVSDACPGYEKSEKWFQNYGFLLHINVYNWM